MNEHPTFYMNVTEISLQEHANNFATKFVQKNLLGATRIKATASR